MTYNAGTSRNSNKRLFENDLSSPVVLTNEISAGNAMRWEYALCFLLSFLWYKCTHNRIDVNLLTEVKKWWYCYLLKDSNASSCGPRFRGKCAFCLLYRTALEPFFLLKKKKTTNVLIQAFI